MRLCSDTSPLNSRNIVYLSQCIGHDPYQKVQTNYPLKVVLSKGLFTWMRGTPGRCGNPLR